MHERMKNWFDALDAVGCAYNVLWIAERGDQKFQYTLRYVAIYGPRDAEGNLPLASSCILNELSEDGSFEVLWTSPYLDVESDVAFVLEQAEDRARRTANREPMGETERVERRIVLRLVTALLRAGYCLGLHDGEDLAVPKTDSAAEILAEVGACDVEELLVYKPENEVRHAWVKLVFGNGVDVISDYTTNLEEVLKPINQFVDALDPR